MIDRFGRLAQEVIVLTLVVASPWAFGANEPVFEWAILAGTAALLILWALRLIVARRADWRLGPIGLALGGLFLVAVVQLVPLAPSVHAAVAPHATALRRDLLPASPEVFADESEPLAASASPHSLSLYPHATRQFVVQILVVFLLFAAVRNQVAGRDRFRRLAWACWANGVLLSVFALAQAVSARPDTVYWSLQTEGAAFGPFICRNHFPFYIHMCLGLSLGLLSATRSHAGHDARSSRKLGAHNWKDELASLLHDPYQLWIVSGMGLMVAASVYSLSRGGLLALGIGVVLCAVARWRALGRPLHWSGIVLVGAGVTLAVAAWLGVDRLTDRVAQLGEREQLRESRLELWKNLTRQVPNYPLVGSGAGSVSVVEPMTRTKPLRGEFFVSEYAHNEYLEALLEGGVIRFALTVFLAFAVLRACWQALRANIARSAFPLVLGATFSLVTVVVHSGFDFGLHLPAAAVLAAVIAGHVAYLAEPEARAESAPAGVIAFPIAVVLVILAAGLFIEGWTNDRVERLRLTARHLARSADAAQRERAFAYWDAALELRPQDAVMHQSCGQAHVDLAIAGDTRHFRPALAHLAAARNLCPLLAHPHVRLAENRDRLAQGDSAFAYLERATRLMPSDAEIWYALGREHWKAGGIDHACAAWHTGLEKSGTRVPDIVRLASTKLSSTDIRERILADDADQMIAAANILFPKDAEPAQRTPFLERALVLRSQSTPTTVQDWRRKAELELALDRSDDALKSFAAAVAIAPRQAELRLEYARQLRRADRLPQAKSELETLLRQDPDNQAARDSLAIVERELNLIVKEKPKEP